MSAMEKFKMATLLFFASFSKCDSDDSELTSKKEMRPAKAGLNLEKDS